MSAFRTVSCNSHSNLCVSRECLTLIVMLKTRQFPARKVLVDRSDIVALHAKLLRRTDDVSR